MSELNNIAIVCVDKVYGKEILRPMNDVAHFLCSIAKDKTMTQHTINMAKRLGFEFKLEGAVPQDFVL